MAITSADPDNNPATPRPSVSFGNASGGGSRSLRTEFPLDTGSSSLSEYYRGGGVVPSSAVIGDEVESTYGSDQLIESRWMFDAGRSGFPTDVDNSAPDYLYYVRKVKTSSAPVPAVNIPVTYALGSNEWRINYIQGQSNNAYISIYYQGSRIYLGGAQQKQTIDATTELTVNGITFLKGNQLNIEEAPNTGRITQRDYSMSTSEPAQVGDLLFAWQYETTGSGDKHGYTFKIPNGIIGEEYEHTDGYTYTTGADASGVNVLFESRGEPAGFFDENDPPESRQYFFRYDNQPIYNTWYDRYYIKRRTTANASNEQTVPLNNLVPTSGPISFSQLYGSKNFYEDSVNITGHSPNASDSNKYIWEASNYPANITTDGTDVRSGVLPNATAYRDGPVPSGFTTYNVPLGTFVIDSSTFIGNIKLALSPTDAATTDIRYYGGLDDDNGDAYVNINEVGIRIVNVDSGNDALVYKGEASPTFSGDGTNGNGRSFTRFLSFNLANVRTDVSSITTDTGRFIVYLTFGYNQPISYGDPDFSLNIDAVKVSWETA